MAASVAVRDDAVDDLEAGVRPGRHGPCHPEVDIVGMSGNHQDSGHLGIIWHAINRTVTRLAWYRAGAGSRVRHLPR
jgi:hypothetical protein